MTESVARVKILAQIEGLEGFDKLKGAFKGLQQAIGPTDQQLEKARRDIIAFGEAGKRTEQIIRGQVDALKALKSQAGTGGQLYTTLGADIRRLEGEVRDLSAAYVDLANNKSYTEKQLRTLLPATSKPGMLSAQVDLMQADLARMQLLTKEYMAQIAKINNATTEGRRKQTTTDLFGAALSGNQYLNNAQFFDAPAAFERQANAGILPRTVAAKQAEISQIKEQLQNVLRDAGNLEPLLNDIRRIETRLATQSTSTGGTRTTIGGLESVGRELGTDWQKARITLGQLTTEYDRLKRAQQDQVRVLETQLLEAEEDLQRMLNGTTKETEELARAEERRMRRLEKLTQIQQDAAKAPGVGGYRDPETGAMLARGNESTRQARENLLTQIQQPVREISALYQSIGAVGISKIANDVERMGNSYQEVAKDIRAAKAASDGSINSLQSQRAAWEALRNSVKANSRDFREATRELATLDKQLERTQPGSLRGKVGYIAQGVGAAASAGIFGGLEGAIGGIGGGLIGAALGGGAPGFAAGSFIGSSVGAYAGMARQQAGMVADYVKQLNLAKVTLAQTSSSQEEYNRQLTLARQISKDYSVGLVDTIKGYSQIASAAQANGLTIKETESIYRGAVAAGVAFGRSQEDIAAIITATVQVLSKGKLSAEELQGQIGERLPGAVAKFAAATGRSLSQLAKDLQNGKVTIADFVKFSEKQVQDYDEIARIIGASPEKAGERLKLALDTAAENYGGFFQQIGSGFQDSITQIISWLNENQDSIKEWVTTWVNAGVEVINTIRAISNFLAPMVQGFINFAQRFYQFMQFNPGVFLSGKFREGIQGIFGVNGGQYTSNQLFPEFKPPTNAFGASGTGAATGKTDLDAEALRQAQEKQLQDQLRLENRLREAQERYQEQIADLREQTIRRAADLERDLGDKRLQIEREIAGVRREIAAEQEDQAFSAERYRLASLGLGTEAIDSAQELAGILRQDTEARIRIQGEAVDRQTQLQRQIEDFKLGVADSIGKVQEGYARSVSDILQSAGDKLALKMVAGAQQAAGVLGGGGGGAVGPSSLRTGSVGGGTLKIGTLVGLAKAAGFNDRDARIMAAIAMAESSGSSVAHNNNPRTGDNSYGLWQINMLGGMGPERRRSFGINNNTQLFDPATNAMAARQIYQSQGFGAWSVYRSGAYRQYLPGAMSAQAQGATSAPSGFDTSGIFRGVQQRGALLGQQSSALKNAELQSNAESTFSKLSSSFASYTSGLNDATKSVKEQYDTQVRIYELMNTGLTPELARQRVETENIANIEIGNLENLERAVNKKLRDATLSEDLRRKYEALRGEIDKRLDSETAIVDAIMAQRQAAEELAQALRFRQDFRIGEGLKEGAQSYVESIGTMRQATAELAQNGIKGVEEALFSLATTGTANFRAFAADILKQTARMIIQQLILRTIMQAIGAIGGGGGGGGFLSGPKALSTTKLTPGGIFAMGGTFANGIQPFATGGIVTKPTLFKFANGGYMNTGLMGEAGPEAIMPLKRGRDGRLGVSGGGSSTTVNVSVDASGSSVQGNAGQGEALGRAVAQAVQAELVRQKRPGGLLAA